MNVAEFRSNLRAWLDENDLTPPPDDHSLDAHHAQHSRVLSALYDAGWMRWGWPESAGGLGGPVILRAVVGEEIVGRGLDEPGPYSMLEVLTPTLIDYARPELAAEMVPLLLSGRETWCQGFSEPGSGSDLASLSTRAEQRGDEWVVNGQKVWTSFAQYATRCVLLTRSGPPGTPNHEAITAFFVDMDTPGITVRPLRTMHGVDEFCEVYFDDVVVPADRMLGQPGDGWRLAMDLHRRARAASTREASPAARRVARQRKGTDARGGRQTTRRRLRPPPRPPVTSARSTKWRDLLALIRPYVGLGEDDYLMLAFISSRFTSTGHPLTLSALPWPVW